MVGRKSQLSLLRVFVPRCFPAPSLHGSPQRITYALGDPERRIRNPHGEGPRTPFPGSFSVSIVDDYNHPVVRNIALRFASLFGGWKKVPNILSQMVVKTKNI